MEPKYAIGPVRRFANNLCEDIFNNGERYIQPLPTQKTQSVAQPIFKTPRHDVEPLKFTTQKLPTLMDTPDPLKKTFEPLHIYSTTTSSSFGLGTSSSFGLGTSSSFGLGSSSSFGFKSFK